MKTIALCASVAHYRQVIEIEAELVRLGFKVLLPDTARAMQKANNFEVKTHKTWYDDPSQYHKKKAFIDAHFRKIEKSDAILVCNFEKNGLQGYIGGNVLMEITVAYYLEKPVYIYNPIDENLPIKEEIYGIMPVFLGGELTKLVP